MVSMVRTTKPILRKLCTASVSALFISHAVLKLMPKAIQNGVNTSENKTLNSFHSAVFSGVPPPSVKLEHAVLRPNILHVFIQPQGVP